MKNAANQGKSFKRLRFLCTKFINRIKIPIISTILVLCTAGIAVASQNIYVSGNVVTYTFSTTTSVNARTCYVYLLTNGANIVTYGSSSASMPRSSHLSGSKSLDMSSSLAKGSRTSGLNYTSSKGGTKKIASRVDFDYTYSKGVFTATVTIYDPDPAITGIAFVGMERSGGSSYYYDINGTVNISDAVYRIYNPTEAPQPETQPLTDPTGPGSGDDKENESREQESRERESRSQEHESKKEDIRESISDIIGGGDPGGGSTGGGGSGGGGSHRPPCVLRRILGHFPS